MYTKPASDEFEFMGKFMYIQPNVHWVYIQPNVHPVYIHPNVHPVYI
jgi:hypothetical protein